MVACDLPGRFPVAPGRSGFEFIARLVELEHFAGSVPEMNPDPYTGASLNPQPLEKIGRIGSEHRFTSTERDLSIPPPVPAVALFALPLPMLFALAWALGLWWLVSMGSGLLVLLLRPLPDAVWLWCRTPSSTAGPLAPTSGWPSEQMVWGSLKLQWTGLRKRECGGSSTKAKVNPMSILPLSIADCSRQTKRSARESMAAGKFSCCM